jgi:hypothetical protein
VLLLSPFFLNENKKSRRWYTVIAAVKDDPQQKRDVSWSKVPKEALHFNVLMFGFDSLSQNTFARKLPLSTRYLHQHFDSIILKGYNIVGDGTPQALIPILTGKIELELPETRKRMGSKAHYVDVYPMIWKDYKQAGFITGFMEDVHHIGTFTYRLKGFDKQPTDHYMRTYYLAASSYFKYSKRFCMGGVPRHMVSYFLYSLFLYNKRTFHIFDFSFTIALLLLLFFSTTLCGRILKSSILFSDNYFQRLLVLYRYYKFDVEAYYI